jgi:hypothetical protein
MNIRSFIPAALVLASLPLAGCSGDDDDGKPNDTPAASPWAGHTYALTTEKRDWSEPRGLGNDIENVMPVFLFQVTQSGAAVTAKMGVAPKALDASGMPTGEIVQDLCSPTYDLPLTGTSPNSQIGPTEVQLHLINRVDVDVPDDDVQVTAKVAGLKFTNIFPPSGTTWADPDDKPGELSATMDFRELAPLFTQLGTPDKPPTDEIVCMQLGTENACEPCADGHVSCLSALATFIGAENQAGLTVQPVELASRPASCVD